MNIKDLVPVDYSNQRVLTTAQVAEIYGVKPKRIHDNFQHAKEQFTEGVHYFKLTGEALRQFKRYTEKIGVAIPPSSTHLYLWTYQGCVRHCKMLNTQAAWDMFNELERVYFAVQAEQPSLSPAEEPIKEELPAPPPVVDDESERLMMRMKKQFAVIKKCEFAVVYVLLMSNLTVKIGYTKDLTERVKKIKSETGLDVFNFYTSRVMTLEDARILEVALKEKFAAYCIGGEYFDVKFSLVCAEF